MHKRTQFVKAIGGAKKTFFGAGKSALAGAVGAALVAGNLFQSIKDKATDAVGTVTSKFDKAEEEPFMKKSTFVALLVVLAAVAGVLAALYVYVLRREKELDEYEQLLFSEDFNDELPADDAAAIDAEEEAE